MIDIHSHILWGLDDGATTFDESLSMLRIAAEAGTTDIVATPHSNAEFEYDPDRIAGQIRELAEQTRSHPVIHQGCDLHLSFDNIVDARERPARYAINGLRYLLVECSNLRIAPSIDAVLNGLLDQGLVPIVTHPERNPLLRDGSKRLEAWVKQGCLVQVTAASVTGGFGKAAQAAAQRLLREGLVHFIASDAHDSVHRHPRLDEAFAAVTAGYGEDQAQLLFIGNPGLALRGAEPSAIRTGHPRREWWRLWRTP